MPWQCPKCKRAFKGTNQSHQCGSFSLEAHFEGKSEEMKLIWEVILAWAEECGPFTVDPVKSIILLKNEAVFLSVKIQKAAVRLAFSLPYEAEGFPIVKTERYRKNQVYHQALLKNADQIDRQVLDWIKDAYNLISNNNAKK